MYFTCLSIGASILSIPCSMILAADLLGDCSIDLHPHILEKFLFPFFSENRRASLRLFLEGGCRARRVR